MSATRLSGNLISVIKGLYTFRTMIDDFNGSGIDLTRLSFDFHHIPHTCCVFSDFIAFKDNLNSQVVILGV